MEPGPVLILIPARGGSKGLLGKNLVPVGGIPLVGRSARLGQRAARVIGAPCRVVCSTDDSAIADAAQAWGAEVPFRRPAELASDGARTGDVVLHALDALGEDFATIVLLQPTSPLTGVEDVAGSVALHRRSGSPVVSVCATEHPTEWLFRLNDGDRLEPLAGRGPAPHQRQETETAFRPNGAVYVAEPRSFRMHQTFFTSDTCGFVMPAERSIDVDTASDLDLVRATIEARAIPPVRIAARAIGDGSPCFVIAEAGVNHNGSLELARKLVDAAADARADAVKFQTFSAERLVTRHAAKAPYQVRTTGSGESQFEMLKRLELDESAHRELIRHCSARGILFLSTPFDEESCDALDDLGVPAFKLSSGEMTNLALLRHAAKKGKPIILSTGMASIREVARAVDAICEEGHGDLVLLHCVSNYPADPADANLKAMATLRGAFGVPVGFSDHTEGDAIALASVALGACVLEKHLTLDRTLAGPDHQSSIEPAALAEMLRRIRSVEAGLGHGRKEPAASEASTARAARRSLVAARHIPAGARLEREMIMARRPGTGLSPDQLDTLVGKTTLVEIPEGALLTIEMLS